MLAWKWSGGCPEELAAETVAGPQKPLQEPRVRAAPTYVILDGEGVVRWVHEGQAKEGVLRRAVQALRSGNEEGSDGR